MTNTFNNRPLKRGYHGRFVKGTGRVVTSGNPKGSNGWGKTRKAKSQKPLPNYDYEIKCKLLRSLNEEILHGIKLELRMKKLRDVMRWRVFGGFILGCIITGAIAYVI